TRRLQALGQGTAKARGFGLWFRGCASSVVRFFVQALLPLAEFFINIVRVPPSRGCGDVPSRDVGRAQSWRVGQEKVNGLTDSVLGGAACGDGDAFAKLLAQRLQGAPQAVEVFGEPSAAGVDDGAEQSHGTLLFSFRGGGWASHKRPSWPGPCQCRRSAASPRGSRGAAG